MNTDSDSRFAVPHVMELSELELATVAGSGWFKRLTGISTPRFLKRFNDAMRAAVPGGWKTISQKLFDF